MANVIQLAKHRDRITVKAGDTLYLSMANSIFPVTVDAKPVSGGTVTVGYGYEVAPPDVTAVAYTNWTPGAVTAEAKDTISNPTSLIKVTAATQDAVISIFSQQP